MISFHNYDEPRGVRESGSSGCRRTSGRSSARSTWRAANGSTFQGSCRSRKKYNVAAINWGFVHGKTQTICRGIRGRSRTWIASRRCGSTISSAGWDAYKADEVEFIREMTEVKVKGKKGKAAKGGR